MEREVDGREGLIKLYEWSAKGSFVHPHTHSPLKYQTGNTGIGID